MLPLKILKIWNSQPLRHTLQGESFKINPTPPICDVNFLKNIFIIQVRLNMRKNRNNSTMLWIDLKGWLLIYFYRLLRALSQKYLSSFLLNFSSSLKFSLHKYSLHFIGFRLLEMHLRLQALLEHKPKNWLYGIFLYIMIKVQITNILIQQVSIRIPSWASIFIPF